MNLVYSPPSPNDSYGHLPFHSPAYPSFSVRLRLHMTYNSALDCVNRSIIPFQFWPAKKCEQWWELEKGTYIVCTKITRSTNSESYPPSPLLYFISRRYRLIGKSQRLPLRVLRPSKETPIETTCVYENHRRRLEAMECSVCNGRRGW